MVREGALIVCSKGRALTECGKGGGSYYVCVKVEEMGDVDWLVGGPHDRHVELVVAGELYHLTSATRLLDCSNPDKCAVCRLSKWNVMLTV